MDDLVRELRSRFGHDDAYDHLAVPGACLGILQERWPEWGKAFWSQLQVAHDLHGDTIREIWLVEHMKCGAYAALLGGGKPLEHEELMHQAMAKLVEGALSEWLQKLPDPKWGIPTIHRKIMRPEDGNDSHWTLDDLAPPAGAAAAPKAATRGRARR
jgi:hypothetical protein